MLVREYYSTRKDGVKLYKTYSDQNMMIQNQNGELYAEAIDPENMIGRVYTETDIPIPEE